MNFSKIKEITIPEGSVKQISIGMQVLWRKPEPAPSIDYLTFTANTAGSTVKMAAVGSPTNTPDLEYSTDGSHWNTYTIGDTITLSNVNDYVQFRGDNDKFYTDDSNCHRFEMTGSIAASGSVMSLLDKTEDMVTMTAANDHCFYGMFDGCTALTTAPKLPATTLAANCYYYMFTGCTSLTAAPKLPATTLAQSCYYGMFWACTSLTTPPALPATTLDSICYEEMFHGCTRLTSSPALPATTLVSRCYSNMFYGCTALTAAPSLPATTLASRCYLNMFYGCTALTAAPSLPATTLSEYCYSNMFKGCTALTSAPVLPATTLVSNCYNSMFRGCSNLNHIEAYFTTTPGDSYTSNWVNGVAASGTFVKSLAATWTTTGVNGIPASWVVQPKDCLKFTANTAGSTIKLSNVVDTGREWVNLTYSTDGKTWSTYNIGTTITLSNVGSYVYFKGNNSTFSKYFGSLHVYHKFEMTGSIAASGSIMSILKADGTATEITGENCFQMLFYGCTSLTTAPSLPATTLSFSCYALMFMNCTALASAPKLPATTLASTCYSSMFQNCHSLREAPELPATTLVTDCYKQMFTNCHALRYVKAMFTTTPGSSYTYSWLYEVSSDGTFVKNRNATWTTTGASGVPTGWTIEYE